LAVKAVAVGCLLELEAEVVLNRLVAGNAVAADISPTHRWTSPSLHEDKDPCCVINEAHTYRLSSAQLCLTSTRSPFVHKHSRAIVMTIPSRKPFEAKLSHDGHTYTPGEGTAGLHPGLKTYGVIDPAEKVGAGAEEKVWECIVVGAGYTGLIAARDLVKAGVSLPGIDSLLAFGPLTWTREANAPSGSPGPSRWEDMECRNRR
jgi:hypothetical protein